MTKAFASVDTVRCRLPGENGEPRSIRGVWRGEPIRRDEADENVIYSAARVLLCSIICHLPCGVYHDGAASFTGRRPVPAALGAPRAVCRRQADAEPEETEDQAGGLVRQPLLRPPSPDRITGSRFLFSARFVALLIQPPPRKAQDPLRQEDDHHDEDDAERNEIGELVAEHAREQIA